VHVQVKRTIVTSNDEIDLKSQFATSSGGGKRTAPYVFTEPMVQQPAAPSTKHVASPIMESATPQLTNSGQMKVLLSMKPQFAEMIFSGIKKYEFRRSLWKHCDVKTIVVYASSPVRKVMGEFEIEAIIYDELVALWEQTKAYAGINEDFFYKYFSNKKYGYAIAIKNVTKYRKPLCLHEDFHVAPPQSFMYLKVETV
jgi:predicted transcriptional regulator